MSTIKIIRSLWGYRDHTYNEIPPVSTHPNEIVYVWGRENETMLKERGFETRYVEEETSPFAYEVLELIYERKLIALDLALKEFGEVIMLDWDWKWENGLVSPNFGFVYSRDITLGEKLIKIAVDNNIEGCVEEHATFLYADCTLDEYIKTYQPTCTYGVSNRALKNGSKVSKLQKKFNDYMDTQLKMDLYCEHI